eukprot:10684070-Karenia_brevis.AAC.1
MSANSPEGLSGKPGGLKELMKLNPQDWIQGPGGLTSMGDMLSMAGYPVEQRETAPPPRPGPVP